MRARVKAGSTLSIVRACVGRNFTRGAWTKLPDEFLIEVRGNPYLEIEQVLSVEPDEPVKPEPDEQVVPPADPPAPSFDVVLAGNAAAVKGFVSSLQSVSGLEEMKQAESKGKARKGVLDAIDDRLTEVEDSE